MHSKILQPRGYSFFSNQTSVQTATSPLISSPHLTHTGGGGINWSHLQIEENPEPYLEIPSSIPSTTENVSSGPRNAIAQTDISTQDQKSITSNPVVTVTQLSVNPVIHDPLTQINSSSSSSVFSVIQAPKSLMAQSTSPIDHESSSSFNNNIPPTSLPHLPSKTVPPTATSMNHQTSSSSSSSSNGNPFQTLLSNSMLTNHPPAQNLPTTTLVGVPVPTAVQTVLLEIVISSAAGLADAILAGMGIVPPGASATPGEVANGAIESVGNGVEVVQIFPTTTLIVSTVSSVPAAATSIVEGPIVLLSASMGILPPVATATPGKPANSAMQSGGNAGGGGNRSSVVTGSGSATGSSLVTGSGSATGRGIATGSGIATGRGSATGRGIATGSGSSTGSGNPTESGSGRTNVPIVPTAGAEGINGWQTWWLGFEILVWGVGMVYWM